MIISQEDNFWFIFEALTKNRPINDWISTKCEATIIQLFVLFLVMSLLFVCVCVLVTQSCTALYHPMDYSLLPGSSVHGILQARILEWVAILFSRGFCWPRDQTQVANIAGRVCTIWATREAHDHDLSGLFFFLLTFNFNPAFFFFLPFTNRGFQALLVKKN